MLKTIFYAALAVIIGLGQGQTALAVSIGFSQGSVENSWDVVLSDLSAGTTVAAFDFDILFNANALLSATTPVSFSPLLGAQSNGYTLPGDLYWRNGIEMPVPAGTIDIWSQSWSTESELLALQGGAGGNITLATLFFDSNGPGASPLSFDWYPGQDIKSYNNEVLYPPVPEPGTLLLLGSGIAGIAAIRRIIVRQRIRT